MPVIDEETRATLDRIVPMDATPPAWEDVLERSRTPRRPRHLARVVIAAAVVAGVTLAAVAPWDRPAHVTLVGRALAAIGDEPVLHAVIHQQGEARPWRLVDIATGETTPQQRNVEREIWFDPSASLGHTITRVNGELEDDTLQTPDGTFNREGVVYTCAWIAAHPVEATKEGLSCRFDGDNGTTPRKIPEAPPTVDPALAAFLTGYRDELESGKAHKVDEGTVEGTAVYWIELAPYLPPPIPGSEEPPGYKPEPILERVAVDREAFRPVLVEWTQGEQKGTYRISEIATVSKDEADFSMPERRAATDEATTGSVLDPTSATRAEAAATLGTAPVWLGDEFKGLRLADIRTVTLRTGFERKTRLPPRFDQGVELIYGTLDERGNPADGAVVVDEATAPSFAWGWDVARIGTPPPGKLLVIGGGFGAFLERGELYVRLQASGSDDELAATARALAPMEVG